jgi:hypothetical protein
VVGARALDVELDPAGDGVPDGLDGALAVAPTAAGIWGNASCYPSRSEAAPPCRSWACTRW